jgi:putative aminopeptidase FrvX
MNLDLLKRLSEAPGIAGREDQVREIVIGELRSLVDELRVDVMGNVIGVRRGNGGPRVMVAAHMDEIGFFVKYIDDKGFLRLQPVGGFDARVLVAQRVVVHGFAGEPLRGVVQPAAKPIHILDPSEIKPAKIEELFVDLGLAADAVRARVEVGDMVTLDRTLETVGDCVIGKALDDRAGVYVMIEALRAAARGTAEIVVVATCQEEVGLRGAQTAAFDIEPTISVALDLTLAGDFPGGPPDQSVTELGRGVAIKVMDSSMISDPRVLRHVRDLADANGIPYQLEILPRGGTDAGAMQRSRGGSPAITFSIPARYVHTVNEMVNSGDLGHCVALLARYLEDAGSRDYHFAQP